jgi:hypothetical protein
LQHYLLDGRIKNEIMVRGSIKHWAKVGLERMLELA